MDKNALVVSGRLYPSTVTLPDILNAEGREDWSPLVIVETPGGTAVIDGDDLNAVDPVALRILKAHLDGERLMIFPQSDEGPSLTDREAQILVEMPLEWGHHKDLTELLGITRRELQRSLERLMAKELIESPSKGYYRRL